MWLEFSNQRKSLNPLLLVELFKRTKISSIENNSLCCKCFKTTKQEELKIWRYEQAQTQPKETNCSASGAKNCKSRKGLHHFVGVYKVQCSEHRQHVHSGYKTAALAYRNFHRNNKNKLHGYKFWKQTDFSSKIILICCDGRRNSINTVNPSQ